MLRGLLILYLSRAPLSGLSFNSCAADGDINIDDDGEDDDDHYYDNTNYQ